MLELARRRFTAEEYYRMATAGILHEDDRVELIAGEIVQMCAIGRRHASRVKWLNRFWVRQLGARAVVGVQDPIRLSRFSEPQPDIAILRPRADFYAAGHPHPDDVLLLIEVADESIRYDRDVKLPLYARAGIPEVWILDLGGGAVEACRDPRGGSYGEVIRLERGKKLAPRAFPKLEVAVTRMLGKTH